MLFYHSIFTRFSAINRPAYPKLSLVEHFKQVNAFGSALWFLGIRKGRFEGVHGEKKADPQVLTHLTTACHSACHYTHHRSV
jgi:hypothetical protein